MERIFALYDSDSLYATRFMEYFKKKKEFNFEISIFTKQESLEVFLLSHQVEILLLGNQTMSDEVSFDKVRYIYKLVDYPSTEKEIECPTIYKYQSAQALMKEIINDYNKKENVAQVVNNSKPVKFISVYSPIQNAEAALFTWALGSLMSEHKKSLLVMLDLLPVPLVSLADDKDFSLTEFIYYLKENTNIILKMKTLLNYNGHLSYLTGISHGADILSLTKEDIRRWADELKNHTDYQTVIFYLGGFSEAMSEVMNISDTVYITGKGTEYERAVQRKWFQQMERSGININKDKHIIVDLQNEKELEQDPLSMADLMNTAAWSSAQQYIKI